MGCGSSIIDPDELQNAPKNRKEDLSPNSHFKSDVSKKNQKNERISSTDSNSNRQDVSSINPVPKSVAFEVVLDGKTSESLIHKHPPKRLQKLEPLLGPPLTAEMLKEKQKLAEEKRQNELQKKVDTSHKTSKRARELLAAKEFEKQQTEQRIHQQVKSAGKNRSAKLADIQERQRIREERARRAREKAKKLNDADQEDLGILDVEKDEEYNADDVDSWLDGDNNDVNSESGERIYSGRASPKKRISHQSNTSRNVTSASTGDSYENAFNMRTVKSGRRHDIEADDFFDS